MNTKPLLSLIVPVYNVAAYLPRCLESLSALRPAPDEIIVVDDGSTDACPQILAQWQLRLPTMRVIRQDNAGLSAARNTGLEVATGEYLAFVDSDDFVEADAYARMIALARSDELDMVLANALYHFEGREPDRLIYEALEDRGVSSGRAWLSQRLQQGRLLHMVWLHLYRHDFIEQHHLRFIPGLIHEDVLWTTEALLLAQRVRVLPEVIYHYRIPIRKFSDEQSNQRLAKIIQGSILNARQLIKFALDKENPPVLKRLLAEQAVDGGFSVFQKLERITNRALRTQIAQQLINESYCRLLWRFAVGARQHRRAARYYLKCRLWALGIQ